MKHQVVISFDTTGSMASCIFRVRSVVEQTITRLLSNDPELELAIIAHGDYCDESTTYLLKSINFTKKKQDLINFIKNTGSTHGGDFPEAYEYVLHNIRTELLWNPEATKTVIMIGDAKPHTPSFAGNLLNIDWEDELKLYKLKNIRIYSVFCGNSVSSKPFWEKLAFETSGYFIQLNQFNAIVDFLIAISLKATGNQNELENFQEEILDRRSMSRNHRELFSTLTPTAELPPYEEAILIPCDPTRFQMLEVTEDMSIKEFVLNSGATFKKGKGFYEFTKREEISLKKEIVLVDKETMDMFTGKDARILSNIPDHIPKQKIKPPPIDKWIMFIQSTSMNRKLIGGTRFLYENSS